MVIPNCESLRIVFQVGAEPVGDPEEFLSASRICCLAPKVVITKAILCNCNWVTLPADIAVIMELGNASRVERTAIICLLGKPHVVLAQFACRSVRVFSWHIVPKTKMTISSKQ